MYLWPAYTFIPHIALTDTMILGAANLRIFETIVPYAFTVDEKYYRHSVYVFAHKDFIKRRYLLFCTWSYFILRTVIAHTTIPLTVI